MIVRGGVACGNLCKVVVALSGACLTTRVLYRGGGCWWCRFQRCLRLRRSCGLRRGYLGSEDDEGERGACATVLGDAQGGIAFILSMRRSCRC